MGNKMLHFTIARLLKTVYKADVYIPRNIHDHLLQYFDGIDVDKIPIAEESLCGFEKFWRIYTEDNRQKMVNSVKEETEKREAQSLRSDIVSVVHSNAIYKLEYEPSEETNSLSSFPWTQFTGSASDFLKREEQKGEAYIFYPAGFLFSTFDDLLDENYAIDNIPGMTEFILNSFQFKPFLVEKIQNTLHQIKKERDRKQKKKKRETQKTLFIGLHNRRTDHLSLQREGGWVPLEAGYFLEAMELYRAWFQDHSLVFLYISDDPQWARKKILPRIKTKGI